MAKNIRRMLAMVMVMCMLVSALPMQSLAAEGDYEFTKTETFTGPEVEITYTEGEAEGEQQIDVTGTNAAGGELTEFTGTEVSSSDSYVDEATGSTIQKDSTHVEITGTETVDGVDKDVAYMEDNTVTTETAANGTVIEQTVTDGTETKTWDENEVEVGQEIPSVEVQLAPGVTNSNSGSGTYTEEVDNVEGGSTEANSDKTTTTVDVERVVEGSMSEVGVTVNKVDTSLVATAPEDYDGKIYDYDDHLLAVGPTDLQDQLQNNPDYNWQDQPTDQDGYDFQWTGYGEATNGARAEAMDVVYAKDPVTGEPLKDAEGNYIIESMTYTGKYNDGMGSTPAIFALSKTNEDGTVEYFYGYCIDNDTEAVPGHWYKISNLEDSNYYPEDDSAAKLRAVALNGYWGTEEGDGSLALIKEKLAAYYDEDDTVTIKDKDGNPKTMTISEVMAGLTEHEALTATQAAIWSNSNGTLATQDGQDGTIITGIYSVDKPNPKLANTDRDYDYESDARMQAMYEWLMALEGVEAQTTIINEQNNIKDMSLVVHDKAAENGENDIYNVDLQFTLDFDLNESDSLTVRLTDSEGNNIKDANGNEIVIEKKLSVSESEDEDVLVAENGVYTLTGLQLSEGTDFNFKLTLDGKQTVEEGVYIYSAYGGTTASQTMVGIASGTQDVNITVESSLSFQSEERAHHSEVRVWYVEGDPVETSPEEPTVPPVEPEEPPVEPPVEPEEEPQVYRMNNAAEPVVEIPEEPVPLAAPVVTGDNSGMWIAVMLLAIFAMVAIDLFDKKRQYNAF